MHQNQTALRALFGAFTLASLTLAAQADTHYVDVNGTAPGAGTSANPWTSIQFALAQPGVTDGDVVRVSPGTYFEVINFLGKNVVVESVAGAGTTLIDGTGLFDAVATFINGETPAAELVGFTLQNGAGFWTGSVTVGGGILIASSNPTIGNCVVRANDAEWGSGIYVQAASPKIRDCTIDSNGSLNFNSKGGGLFLVDAAPTVVNTEIEDNAATTGGGIYSLDSHPRVRFATIDANSSILQGGGVYTEGFYPLTNGESGLYEDTLFHDNRSSDDNGGGFYSASGDPVMKRCSFSDNTADNDHSGGSIYVAAGTFWFDDGSIIGGTAAEGAGIYNAGVAVLTNSELTGNRAISFQALTGNGGGLYAAPASVTTVRQCVFDANQAIPGPGPGGLGGAVFGPAFLDRCTVINHVSGGGAYNATLHNVIHWGNLPTTTGASSATYSDIQGGHAGVGNIDADPLLTTGYQLTAGSPCIDTGDPGLLDPDGSRSDMGAFPFASCKAPETYCTAGTSASGCQAQLATIGTPSASAGSGFQVLAASVEGQKDGLYFYGTNGRQLNSWGTGTSFQCVLPPVKRGPLMSGTGTPGTCGGVFALDLNARWAAIPAHNPGAGARVQLQLWYRDPQNSSNQTTSLSNALEFGVCP